MGRTTELTRAGRILFEHVEDAFTALDRGRARLGQLKNLEEGELTVAASDTTACYVLPKVLAAFRRRYPGIDLRISNRPSPVAAEQVAARRADIAIVTLPLEHPKLNAEALQAREDVAICAARHAIAARKRIALTDLLRHSLILLDRGSNTRSFIDRRIDRIGIQPRIAMEVGSIEVIKRLVELDFGVSIVPRIAVRNEIRQGTLAAIRIFPRRDWRWIGLLYPKKGIANLAAEAFVRVLRKTLIVRGR
jgi:DNA-binding transcriptional LysR family regulator